jgi:hypothetical protein
MKELGSNNRNHYRTEISKATHSGEFKWIGRKNLGRQTVICEEINSASASSKTMNLSHLFLSNGGRQRGT